MMNFNEWRLIRESLQGSTTIGLGYPQTIGGVMGSHFSEGGFGDKGKPVEDDEFDDEDEFDDDDDGSDEGDEDLFGNSEEDTGGPTKNFPPEQGGSDDFGDEEGDDDFLASIGAGAGGDDMGGAGFGGAQDTGGEPDMSFLDNIPDDLMGDQPMGGDDAMSQDAGGEMPCPDCNHEGEHDIGEDGCPTCDGEGFVADDGLGGDDMGGLEDLGLDGGAEDINGLDDLGGDELGDDMGDDLGGDELGDDMGDDLGPKDHQKDDMDQLMKHMQSYMSRYMQKEQAQVSEFAQAPQQMQQGMMGQPNQMQQQQPNQMQQRPMQQMQQQQPNQMQQNPQQQQMKKRMVKFMSKRGERSFMASDTPRQYMKKDSAKTKKDMCCKEDNDFLNSLAKNMARPQGGVSGFSEDALFNLAGPNDTYAQNDPQAGQTGFAPQGRVGSIGGGYTMDDMKDLPVLGESVRFPTLTEYAVRKARAAKKRRS